ncbi:MAG: UDP-2,4-diacetamido-2,4,6-trideoxy-beta-L-altropyranose hydrolase [Paraglaciecola sp.]|uniref:UDP-2,4-diacetamido-2,4, 6-trideoxy-beta-L-altropyranose hydrolase n=1 Tax=Paraglaciecola sp. TaxID=1920173 RepID=UPI00273DCB33|nr:UDP-2,4-diacetamido-2,4,6-trideoxy-beta-L-altropyranose hydrolase [Paraglaciecola sp.]MDP5029278.1 UDP-2,4-diacetamido-2,4,6-trideoxy-beta-L-altropyranose hydrolase [Paraglaciecola sp.]MDP5131093.1 UDP-2,4-diacetamido-2,4,6-trideoxy-beta-L-altropyranose hydrolase [Paraglaciecola sp.]
MTNETVICAIATGCSLSFMDLGIVFRVDATVTMGMGHLLRCLALAQGLVKQDPTVSITFVLRAESVSLAQSRQDWVGHIVILPRELSQAQEPQWLASYCQTHNIQVIILDGYQFQVDYRQALARIPVQNVVFDDNNDSGPLAADLVINGASNAASLGYEDTAPDAILCVGNDYRILREEFVEGRYRLPWAQRNAVVLVMGGSDADNLTLQILQGLEQCAFKPCVTVVTGGAYAHLAKLRQFLQHSQLTSLHLDNCQQMAALFGQAKLVVSAAGGTQFELLACDCPALLLVVADNQANAAAQAVTQGWCQLVDVRGQANIHEVVAAIEHLCAQPDMLRTMHEKATCLADTQGTARVAKQMLLLAGRLND